MIQKNIKLIILIFLIAPFNFFIILMINSSNVGTFISTDSDCKMEIFVIPEVPTPELDEILPNPDYDGTINLNWNDVTHIKEFGPIKYWIFRDKSPITSIPWDPRYKSIATVNVSHYQDNITSSGTYYYAIVAFNNYMESDLSNCESVNVSLPPSAPELNPILPNPNNDGIIKLNWSSVVEATNYSIYRDTSIITSIETLSLIATVSIKNYQNNISSSGTYYYVIVANNASGESPISNCEGVNVSLPPSAPELNPILPNPNNDGIIKLNWSSVVGATNYSIYRNTSIITSIDTLSPIATVSINNYQDNINSSGTYYYVIVANNASGESPISNCESVEVAIPPEIDLILIGLIFGIIGIGIICAVIIKKTRSKDKGHWITKDGRRIYIKDKK